MPERHCKRCGAPIGPRVTLCDPCRDAQRTQAWKRQGAERRVMAAEYDIDAIPFTVGLPNPRYELTDHDLQLFDAAITRYLHTQEGVRPC